MTYRGPITEGYFGFMGEWAPRVASPNPEYLISFNNGDCLIEYWTPRSQDDQKPHDRDEIYVIVAGNSKFEMGDEKRSVKAGDLIFVPAGMPHRFFEFSDELAMWIAFFGKRYDGFDPTP
jgi:mannose-6-phosphate isomerase-like protein (cupin superfamily)